MVCLCFKWPFQPKCCLNSKLQLVASWLSKLSRKLESFSLWILDLNVSVKVGRLKISKIKVCTYSHKCMVLSPMSPDKVVFRGRLYDGHGYLGAKHRVIVKHLVNIFHYSSWSPMSMSQSHLHDGIVLVHRVVLNAVIMLQQQQHYIRCLHTPLTICGATQVDVQIENNWKRFYNSFFCRLWNNTKIMTQ